LCLDRGPPLPCLISISLHSQFATITSSMPDITISAVNITLHWKEVWLKDLNIQVILEVLTSKECSEHPFLKRLEVPDDPFLKYMLIIVSHTKPWVKGNFRIYLQELLLITICIVWPISRPSVITENLGNIEQTS
jgi:hypothetical protein